MAKKIYFETVKKWAKNMGIPIGIASITILFMYLSFLGVIEVTGHSGDMVCAGTIEDPCIAFINFTVKEDIFIYPIGYDPYGRDTPFKTDTELKSWRIYRSWGKGWREIKLNQTCTATWCGAPSKSSNKYAFAFRKGRNYTIKIEALKKVPSEDVKWGFGPIDPYWFGSSDYIIDGDLVYIDNNKTYISAYPHTISESGWIYFNITSKIYEGNIDIVWGFNTSLMKPKKAELYKPELKNRIKSYICEGYFNYTRDPNHFWCYYNNSNTSQLELIYERDFEWGNLAEKTVYWNETYLQEWKDYSHTFYSKNYDFGGMNKWYYIKNIPVQKNQGYLIRGFIEIPRKGGFSPIKVDEKYWVAIKPSGETIQQAITNNHLYYLDPWINSSGDDINKDYLDNGLRIYHNFSSPVDYINGTNNLSAREGSMIFNSTDCLIGICGQTIEENNFKLNFSGYNFTNDYTINFWVRGLSADSPNTYFFASDDNGGNSKNIGWDSPTRFWFQDNWKGTAYQTDEHYGFGNWVMISVTKKGTNVSIYVNGTLKSSEIGGGSYNSPTELYIGTHGISGLDFDWHGQIDEFGFWIRSLNGTEISDLFNSGAGITYKLPSPYLCTFKGFVKDNNGNPLPDVTVFILNQKDFSLFNTTSNESGAWEYSVPVGNYTVFGYEDFNITREGDIKPHISCQE